MFIFNESVMANVFYRKSNASRLAFVITEILKHLKNQPPLKVNILIQRTLCADE